MHTQALPQTLLSSLTSLNGLLSKTQAPRFWSSEVSWSRNVMERVVPGSRIVQHTLSQSTCPMPPLCSPVKLRDFESAVRNFEKALERAKLVHNNEAQQAIVSVSCPPPGPQLRGGRGWVLSPSVSHSPGIYYPPTTGRVRGGVVAFKRCCSQFIQQPDIPILIRNKQ